MKSLAREAWDALRERVAFGVLRAGVRLLPTRVRAECSLIVDVALKHVEMRMHDDPFAAWERAGCPMPATCAHGKVTTIDPTTCFEHEPCLACEREVGRGRRRYPERAL